MPGQGGPGLGFLMGGSSRVQRVDFPSRCYLSNNDPKASPAKPLRAQEVSISPPVPMPAPAGDTSGAPDEFQQLLRQATAGDAEAWNQLLKLIYEELRRFASVLMRREPSGQTLQPTALVHEAYMKLMHQENAMWVDRRHFFNAAAQAMRRIMVDRARRYMRVKHGGEVRREDLDVVQIPALEDFPIDVAEQLDFELAELEKQQPRWAEVVRLRCFAGLTVEQVAQVMDLAERTVRSDWRFARAWLMSRVIGEGTTTRNVKIAEIKIARNGGKKPGDADDE